ncbi:hypothetical protein IFM89_030404 [Coptis chinensis]|uniref:Nodulin-like domain-containing protein n=1 Tax=Coptis chinensis TaxID=261450 RepID=A0A835LTH9_9MAGN|nr:hypothetical protein IFM89_030404 [Coptis chinensis]
MSKITLQDTSKIDLGSEGRPATKLYGPLPNIKASESDKTLRDGLTNLCRVSVLSATFWRDSDSEADLILSTVVAAGYTTFAEAAVRAQSKFFWPDFCCSICWFNTVCFVLCIKNFPTNRALALSLTISFNGVSPALYTLIANAISSTDSSSLYLVLNSLVPLVTSFAALIPILRQPPLEPLSTKAARRDSLIFLLLNILAVFTGLYLLFFNSISSSAYTARLLFSGAILLLVFPLGIPGIVFAREWARCTIHTSFRLEGSGFNLVEVDDLELHKELLGRENYNDNGNGDVGYNMAEKEGCCEKAIVKDQLTVLGEEHPAHLLIRRCDFWLYYVAYFCGGTIGLVYSNNLGQIAQSLGNSPKATTLVTLNLLNPPPAELGKLKRHAKSPAEFFKLFLFNLHRGTLICPPVKTELRRVQLTEGCPFRIKDCENKYLFATNVE